MKLLNAQEARNKSTSHLENAYKTEVSEELNTIIEEINRAIQIDELKITSDNRISEENCSLLEQKGYLVTEDEDIPGSYDYYTIISWETPNL